ncbi:unnamed protein product [Alopecurus aequalis]
MRNNRCLSLATVVILVLVLTAMEAEGIRLDAETRESVSRSNLMVNKASAEVVKGSTASSVSDATRSAVAAGEVMAVAHGLPEFHEDYYVAGVHSPRHH